MNIAVWIFYSRSRSNILHRSLVSLFYSASRMNYFTDIEESDRSRNEGFVLVSPALQFMLHDSVLLT